MKCSPWQIWWADVVFDDSDESKVRPVLVFDTKRCLALSLKMTSHAPRCGDYALVDWKKSGLREPTTVRFARVIELRENDILNQIGAVMTRDRINIARIMKQM